MKLFLASRMVLIRVIYSGHPIVLREGQCGVKQTKRGKGKERRGGHRRGKSIPAGPLGSLKCDPPKGNGRRPKKKTQKG